VKKKFLDTNIKNKSKTVEEKIQLIEINGNFLPLPTEIEISESGTCNRKCSFCPRSDPDYEDKKEFISNDLHRKLCSELKELNYKGTVRYSGFVEPMVDKNIFNLIGMTNAYLPKSNIEMVTNGDLLNLKRLKKLFEAGLSTILISVYDGPEDMVKFEKMCISAGLDKKQYVIRNRYLPPEEDFGITISNRSGLMDNAEHKISSLETALKEPCFYPSYSFFIDYNGDVLMCSHDWGKKNILGNLNSSSIYEIWTSQNAENSRKNLYNAKRNFSPCNVCDVKGSLIGQDHAKKFKEIHK